MYFLEGLGGVAVEGVEGCGEISDLSSISHLVFPFWFVVLRDGQAIVQRSPRVFHNVVY